MLLFLENRKKMSDLQTEFSDTMEKIIVTCSN